VLDSKCRLEAIFLYIWLGHWPCKAIPTRLLLYMLTPAGGDFICIWRDIIMDSVNSKASVLSIFEMTRHLAKWR
jgi:hypothetical protein